MKKLLGIIAVTVILISMVGCNIANNYTIDSFETMNDTEKSMSYKEFQGEKEYKLNVKSGGATVFVDVVSKAGSLDASIMNESDKTDIIYEGKNIQTGSFSVDIKNEGTYLICLSADHHSGSYSFTVEDIEENTEQDTNIDMPILDEINQNVQMGTTGAYMTAVQEAVKMLDWGTGTGLDTQEIREATTVWLMNKGNDEQVAFAEKLRQVDDAYHKLLGSDAQQLMESAGCESDSYPWNDTLVEPIEAVMDVVGLRPYEGNDAQTEA